jgi:hypothetical protein
MRGWLRTAARIKSSNSVELHQSAPPMRPRAFSHSLRVQAVLGRRHQDQIIWRTSTKCPASAAAAAIEELTK